ncbi:MAG: hypothetical protein ACRCTW_07660 [Lactococcus garvieae]
MPAKKVKIFETGNYLQGNFPSEAVAGIFAATENAIPAQFAHTSKLQKAGKDPVILGEFSKIELENDTIFGWLEFNDKGQSYFDDGIISGVSVEIADGKIDRIAVLPVGVNPQIAGAEFEDNGTLTFGGTMEFEEVPVVTLEQAISVIESLDASEITEREMDRIYDAVWNKSDERRAVEKLTKAGYNVAKKPVEFEEMTKEEIALEIKKQYAAEFQAKESGSAKFKELKAKGAITPAMEKAGLTAEFMSALEYQVANNSGRLEFADASFEPAKVLMNVLDNIGALVNMNKGTVEFQYEGSKGAADKTTLTLDQARQAAAERSKNL